MEEIWKDVIGFEGRFKISNHGRVLSTNGRYKADKIIGCHVEKSTGYNQVVLNAFGKRAYTRIHVLVANHFVDGKSEINNCVNHLDGNKLNNHYTNLEWTTLGLNFKHAYRIGLIDARGEKSATSKIKNEDVIRIRELSNSGCSQRQIKTMMGLPISIRHMNDIINKVNWKHI